MQFTKSLIIAVAAVTQLASGFSFADNIGFELAARSYDDDFEFGGLTARDNIEIQLFARHLDDILDEFVLERRGGDKYSSSEAKDSHSAWGLSGSAKEHKDRVNKNIKADGGDASKSRDRLSKSIDKDIARGQSDRTTKKMAAAAAAHGKNWGN